MQNNNQDWVWVKLKAADKGVRSCLFRLPNLIGEEQSFRIRNRFINPAENSEWRTVEDGIPSLVDIEKKNRETWVITQDTKGRICTSSLWALHTYKHEYVAWMPLPSPYEPPVKLRESCEVCEHYEQWTEFVCPKTKTVNPHPHWVGNKPCHED